MDFVIGDRWLVVCGAERHLKVPDHFARENDIVKPRLVNYSYISVNMSWCAKLIKFVSISMSHAIAYDI